MGYSPLMAKEIRNAPSAMLGVQLGVICLSLDIPIKDVAEYIGVSGTTVSLWFRGRLVVSAKHQDKVYELVEKLK